MTQDGQPVVGHSRQARQGRGRACARSGGNDSRPHESSQRIRDITSVIDGIAFQTNILALERGRGGRTRRRARQGFAVVAAEVRSLAKRSAEAAQEIKTIIQTNTEKMDAGTELAEKAGTAVQEVVTSIERVNATAADVAVASREQSDGIDQISQAVMQLDQATQQNAALVEGNPLPPPATWTTSAITQAADFTLPPWPEAQRTRLLRLRALERSSLWRRTPPYCPSSIKTTFESRPEVLAMAAQPNSFAGTDHAKAYRCFHPGSASLCHD